jgi:hypothetical protein
MVSIVLPRDADVARVRELLVDRFKLAARMEVPEGTRDDLFCELIGRGKMGCFCLTEIGSFGRPPPAWDAHELESKNTGFRKKGWSEARIQRWLEQKHATSNRKQAEYARWVEGTNDDDTVGGWLPFVKTVLESGAAQRIGIVHYEDLLRSLRAGPRTPVAELRPLTLYQMESGTIHTFFAR